MVTQKDQIKKFADSWNRDIHSLNTPNAKYYGATFYGKNKWDGSFSQWNDEDMERYDYIYDMTKKTFLKEKNGRR